MKEIIEEIKEVAEFNVLPDGDSVNVPTALWLEDIVQRIHLSSSGSAGVRLFCEINERKINNGQHKNSRSNRNEV